MPTANIVTTSTVTGNWDTLVGAATHHEAIDEGTTAPSDADYIETTTLSDQDEFGLGDTPANTDTVTQVDLNIRARITDSGGTRVIRAELFHSGGTPVTGNPKDITTTDLGGSGVLATVQKSWTSLSLTKAQADSLQLRLTFQ